MTIAACYLSSEGVVLGADSTTTVFGHNGAHYFDHAQKVFEIGEGQSLGVITWGLGGLGVSSYRQLLARFGDDLKANPAASVSQAAIRWTTLFYAEYVASPFLIEYARLKALQPFDAALVGAPGHRTEDEEKLYGEWTVGMVAGFCFGGCLRQDRQPEATWVVFDPNSVAPPVPVDFVAPDFGFWGAPLIVKRLIWGCDDNLQTAILGSPHWTGTQAQLETLVNQTFLAHGPLPMREAVDFVHFGIFSTIKALKFSNFSQICGGPIEIAVITADRPFRWVRHKPWDSAILEGAL
jgi:hypothetical protein